MQERGASLADGRAVATTLTRPLRGGFHGGTEGRTQQDGKGVDRGDVHLHPIVDCWIRITFSYHS